MREYNKYINGVKVFLKQKSNYIPLALLIILVTAFVSSKPVDQEELTDKQQQSYQNSLVTASNDNSIVSLRQLSQLSDSNWYSELPVSEVKSYPVNNEKGVAILIPQYHKYPGSDSADPRNGSAAKNQEEILKVLESLKSNFNLNMVMTEGELNGLVPTPKISEVEGKIQARDELSKTAAELKSVLASGPLNQSSAAVGVMNQIEKTLANANQDILLTGAAHVFKTKHNDISLVGSENQDTLDQSRDIVRDHIYIQDQISRINNLATSRRVPSNLLDSDTNINDVLYQLLSRRAGVSATGASEFQFTALSNQAAQAGQTQVKSLVDLAASQLSKLTELINPQTGINQLMPSRSQNPYSGITNQNQLNEMIKESENKIEQVVVEKRNHETAVNFAQSLNLANEKVGALQFGAGHTDGLIKELNNQGLSVVVIVTDEVTARNGGS